MAAIRIIDDHLELANIGSNTHAQIDTHITDVSAHHTKYTDAEAVAAITSDKEGCGVERIAAQSIPSHTWTKVNFDTEFFDLNDAYSLVTYKYVAPKSGYYQINASITITALPVNVLFVVWIKKNGSGIVQGRDYSGGGTYTAANISTIAYLTASDYIEVYVYHYDSATRNLKVGAASSTMSLMKI